MASTTTIPEVSTNEGPGGDDGRIAGSAATAEAADSEEETWYTPQDAVEAGRKAPALPPGGGGYDRSLGAGGPPNSPPKPVGFGFFFCGNVAKKGGGGVLYILL